MHRPSELDKRVADFRRQQLANHPGIKQLRELGEQRRAAQADAQQAVREAREQAAADRGAATVEARRVQLELAWVQHGGTRAEFAADVWPDLRRELITRAALEREAAAKSSFRRSIRSGF